MSTYDNRSKDNLYDAIYNACNDALSELTVQDVIDVLMQAVKDVLIYLIH